MELKMQDTLTFPTLHEGVSPPRFTFPELLPHQHPTDFYGTSACCSELSSSTSTPFVSAPSSPSYRSKAFYFSAPTSPSWSQRVSPEKLGSPSVCPSFHGSSYLLPQKSHQAEYNRSSWAQPSLETERLRNPASLQIKPLYAADSDFSPYPQPITTDFATRKALKRLQVDNSDTSYSRKSFYASAVPFSWEEKPGTPKARSITSEASNGEDDSPSNLLSGSSEFEFSARFSELEDPPMSPTPISSPFYSFKRQYAYGSPANSTHTHTYQTYPGMQGETGSEEHLGPLRPPPCLDHPVSSKQSIKDEGNELKRSHRSLASLSTPQSPRSPRKFDIRGALCGMASPPVFDPFLTAMEKATMKNGDDSGSFEEAGKSSKKKAKRNNLHGHLHRRTQSLSPLRVFHWDDHSAKSFSSSNGSSNMDEVKNKHPIQREINARHSAGTPKGLKKWSFKGFMHRKSVSGAESAARHSNISSASLRSSGRESCSSTGTFTGDGLMDMEDNMKTRGTNSPASVVASMTSTPSFILSSSSSNNSSKGKLITNRSSKGPYVYHYGAQQAHAEELRKKTFLPYRQGLLGCLGLSSRSYRAIASLSKPLQSVS